MIALEGVTRGLKNKVSFVEREISFCILAAKRELPYVGKMSLALYGKIGFLCEGKSEQREYDKENKMEAASTHGFGFGIRLLIQLEG
ncbi:MAG TPA: hypothetical protein VFG32_03680 [Bacteroidota bacterium]|nr:hypothetical protein [Bacteroidota bacterium]